MQEDKDLEEYGGELEGKPSHHEAPASVNMKCWIDGYGVMFTFRSDKGDDVVKKVTTLIEHAKEKGWKTDWNDTPASRNIDEALDQIGPDKIICEQCGALASKRTGIRKNGSTWIGIFCSKNKNHVKWID